MRSLFDNALSKIGIRPIAADSAQTSSAIDSKGFNTGMAQIEIGAATGTPSSYTVDAKVQQSADGSTSWTDVTDAEIVQIVADDKSAQIRIEGLGTSVQRFIRLVITPAMSGGSSPKALISGTILLGRAFRKAVGNSATGA